MRTFVIGVSLAVLAATTAAAEDAAPPKPPTGVAYAGPCVSPALNAGFKKDEVGTRQEGAFLSGLLVNTGSAIIGKGFDWVGAQLTRMAESERTDISGRRTAENKFDSYYCVQIVRFSEDGSTLDDLVKDLKGWSSRSDFKNPNVPFGRKIDLFAEYWIRPSFDNESITFTPSLIYYPKLMAKAKSNSKSTYITKISVTIGDASAVATWPLPASTKPDGKLLSLLPIADLDAEKKIYTQSLTALAKACEIECEGASPWLKNPWKKVQVAGAAHSTQTGEAAAPAAKASAAAPAPAKKLADGLPGSEEAKPTAGKVEYAVATANIELTWTEIRDASKFWKAVADAWNANKADAKAEVEKLIFDQKREEAEVVATNASVTALSTYATKLDEAESNRATAYCSAKDTPAGPKWTALSTTLRAKQLAANVAASGAGQPLPFATPIAITAEYQPAICPASG
jgi:hypothetical protein